MECIDMECMDIVGDGLSLVIDELDGCDINGGGLTGTGCIIVYIESPVLNAFLLPSVVMSSWLCTAVIPGTTGLLPIRSMLKRLSVTSFVPSFSSGVTLERPLRHHFDHS